MENQQVENQPVNTPPDVWGGTTPQVPLEPTPEQIQQNDPPAPVVQDPPAVAPKEDVKTEPKKEEAVPTPPQEKIVEKIVEKYPEFKDDYSKQIYEAILSGKEEELKSYFDEKFRDYNTMSDRENIEFKLKKDNPSWTQKDIEAEVKFKYGKSFDKIDLTEIDSSLDPDRYQKALTHNEDVERRELMLERDARDARVWNNEQKKNIELPKIPVAEQPQPQPELTQEQIDELNREWESKVAEEVPKISDFTFSVNGEEVSYKVTDEDKASLKEKMDSFEVRDYLTARGWFDEQGNVNVKAIAEDVYKLENMAKIVASSATQMKTAAKKEVVADIKNLDLNPSQQVPELSGDVGSLIWAQ